jgi:hypothetical protein
MPNNLLSPTSTMNSATSLKKQIPSSKLRFLTLTLVLLSAALPSCRDRVADENEAKTEASSQSDAKSEDTMQSELKNQKAGPKIPRESQVKVMLVKAASIDRDVWKKTTSSSPGSYEEATEKEGESLVLYLLYAPRAEAGAPRSFTYPESADPSKIAGAISGTNPIDFRLYDSLIQLKYITKLDFHLEGDRLMGKVSFEATNKAYRGTLGFEGTTPYLLLA